MTATIMSDIIKFSNFSKVKGLIHGFSTRKFGNIRPNQPDRDQAMELFCKDLNISQTYLVTMQQVHGVNVEEVTREQRGWRILQTDGLITQSKETYLSVLAADCMPILIYDKVKNKAGAVHAGWKGVYSQIIKEAIKQLELLGSESKDIIVGIGPCIRSCCYNVPKERAEKFKRKFKDYTNFLSNKDGREFLDLPSLAKQQLLDVGISRENIEDCGLCTYDNHDLLYSSRKEGENFGEFIGIIGMR